MVQKSTTKKTKAAAPKSTEKKVKETEKTDQQKELQIVGIGTSAGGLEALQDFFDNMPIASNAAFVIVQHLSPDFKSLMVEILSKHTKMNVYEVKNKTKVEAGNIYLIPAKKNLTIKGGRLLLAEKEPTVKLNLPIDIFFKSLAQDQGENAISIILSGTGTDGTRGIRAIKEEGGVIMVQEPDSAKFDGMPKSAISTGLVDVILPSANIPQALMAYLGHSKSINHGAKEDKENAVQKTLNKIFSLIQSQTTVNFANYKPNTIHRRIEKRMGINKIHGLDQYLNFMYEQPQEVHTLQKELLIGVTKFFRDENAFLEIQKKIIPEIVQSKKPDEPIRIWASASSTGEEAYSLAILFMEYFQQNNITPNIKIFATDVDREAITKAGAGIYPESIAADISQERLGTYFTKRGDYYIVNKFLRECILFSPHDILIDPPFTRLDLVLCRNLLIYLNNSVQQKVLSNFHYSLNPQGYLFLGASESIGDLSSYFHTSNQRYKIYQKKFGSKAPNYGEEERIRDGLDTSTLVSHGRMRASSTIKKMGFTDFLNEIIIDEYAPMCIFTNEHMEVVHLTGGVSRYLQLPEKNLSLNILRMVPTQLASVIGLALQRIIKNPQDLVYKNIQINLNDKIEYLNLEFKPVTGANIKQNLILILLEQAKIIDKKQADDQKFDPASLDTERLELLEGELREAKANLQATVEELETTNEELQATNEELLAANEELQSTNEELQSVNEELYTVNSELQEKVVQLNELNDDMNNLLKVTEIGTLFLDTNLRIRKFTPAIRNQFDLLEQDINRPLNNFSMTIGNANIIRDVKQVLEYDKPFEKEFSNPDGKYYLERILPYKTEKGEIKGVVITFVDITLLKETEKELQKSENEFQELYNTAQDFFITYDVKTNKIQKVNQTIHNKLKFKEEDVIDKTITTLFSLKENPDFKKTQKQIIKDGYINDQELKILVANGKSLDVSVSGSIITHKEENISICNLVARDITERKELTDQIKSAKENLEKRIAERTTELVKSNKELEEFGYIASHDLKAPIVNIGALVKLLEEMEGLTPSHMDLIDKINDSLTQMDETIQNLNEVLTVKQHFSNDSTKIKFNEVLDDILSGIGELISHSKIEIKSDFKKAPEILFPRMHLRSILQNLITNAIKYSKKEAKSFVEIKTVREGDYILLTVKDNGVGLDLAKKGQSIFGLFKRFHTNVEGRGIGLYMVKSITENHGGKVGLESELGKGSTFKIYLKVND